MAINYAISLERLTMTLSSNTNSGITAIGDDGLGRAVR